MAAAAEPFALSAQHKKAWRLRKEQTLHAAGDGGGAETGGSAAVLGEGKGAEKASDAVETDEIAVNVEEKVQEVQQSMDLEAEEGVQKVQKSKDLSKAVNLFGDYAPEKYKNTRYQFIQERCASGTPWKLASLAWDLSDVKRKLLKDVSLPELKRRRFVGKEATVNPWASQ